MHVVAGTARENFDKGLVRSHQTLKAEELAAIVPPYATSVVLLMVGAFMFRSVSEIKLEHLEDTLPAFVTIILIPLTFSIAQGILWGFISHAAFYLIAGRAREVSPVMYVLALISVGLVLLEHGNF